MKDRVAGGPLDRLGGARHDPVRWSVIVVRPFDGAPVENAGPDSGTEEHRYPAEGRELRWRIVVGQPHTPVATEREPGQKYEVDHRGPDVQHTEVSSDEVEDALDRRTPGVRGEDERDRNRQQQNYRRYEDEAVDFGALHALPRYASGAYVRGSLFRPVPLPPPDEPRPPARAGTPLRRCAANAPRPATW